MTNREFLEQIEGLNINYEKVEQIRSIYNANLPEDVKKLVSNCDEGVFWDNGRVLSFSEILHADVEYDVDFVEEKILPLIDYFDNDFIVYCYEEKIWAMYNIVDQIRFKESTSLEEILK